MSARSSTRVTMCLANAVTCDCVPCQHAFQGDVHVEIVEKFCIEFAPKFFFPFPCKLHSQYPPSLSQLLSPSHVSSSRYSRDGGVNSSELKGDMILTVNSEAAAFVRVNLAPIRDKTLQLKNHPNINKQVRGFSGRAQRREFNLMRQKIDSIKLNSTQLSVFLCSCSPATMPSATKTPASRSPLVRIPTPSISISTGFQLQIYGANRYSPPNSEVEIRRLCRPFRSD
jgi:hypothetical protein